jgi:hypothetical protein
VGKAVWRWELNIYFWEINTHVMFFQPWYSKDEGIMTNGGHISDEFFIMVTNGIVNMDVFGNITGGNRSSIDDFDGLCGFQLVMGKIVLAGEFVIHEGISSASTVNKGMGVNS